MIGYVVSSYDIDVILNSGNLIKSSPYYYTMSFTFALGCLSKSAQFPLFWLPNAMAAPLPVISAYLRSATLVKVGVFANRFWPVLAGAEASGFISSRLRV